VSAIIEIAELSKLYGFGDATTIALDELNLSIEKGEFVAVMGPSGSGKSTLMNIIGLLDRPTHGQYKLDDKEVARLRSNKRAKVRRDKIGFVFQSFNLLPRLTVLENVALPLAYKGMTTVKRLKQASQILDRVGLREREYYMPRQLSGGQMQRVAIARALVNSPSIVIADEPTGNLDSTSSRAVMQLLSEMHQEGHTILMVTHNPELTRYSSRVIYMRDGSIIDDETTDIGTVSRRAMELSFMPVPEYANTTPVPVTPPGLSRRSHDSDGNKKHKDKKKKKRGKK
jgi:putative ABC transport system ATP-binding protein